MKLAHLNIRIAFLSIASAALLGCTGIPTSTDVNPEFRKQMEGKTIGEATGTPALWGQTEESIAKKVFPGRSTKADIRSLFGASTKVSLTETGETWTYESTVTTVFTGASHTQSTLIILFDSAGIVRRYSMNVNTR